MNALISEDTSKRITSLRFLLAVFVVFLHNELDANIAIYYNLKFQEPFVITLIKTFFCNILANAAVPLFFVFSGYLQFKKNDTYFCLLKKKFKSLLLPYIFWNILGVLFFFIGQTFPTFAPYFQDQENIVRNFNLSSWLNVFWAHDTHSPLHHPFVGQLWFVRDLIILVIVSPIIKILLKKYVFSIIVISIFCYANILTLGFGTAIFFYSVGAFFALYDIDFFRIADKISYIEIFIFFIFDLLIFFTVGEKIKMWGLDIIITCIFFLKFSNVIVSNQKMWYFSEKFAVYSFFLYAIHIPFLLTVLQKISYKIIPLHGFGCLIQFILPSVLTVIVGVIIGIILKKICMPLFSILNGGRK